MEDQLLSRRLSRPRAALVVAVAAALAAVVAVSPSFADSVAGSFLTNEKASRLYLTSKRASGIYLKKKAAGHLFVKKAEAPLAPIASIAAGTAAFSAAATTAGYIPTAFTSFATKANAPAVITFSGSAICTAEKPTAELACPIQILVDGQSTGKVNFAPATEANKAAPLVHTVTQTTVLLKGGHTIAVQYAGAAKVTFTLKSWNLAVQAYPEAPEPVTGPTDGATPDGAATRRG
jgi:hypothetical protein